MKIDLQEIWEFMELVPAPKSSNPDTVWAHQLVAGDIKVNNLSSGDISSLKKAEVYDTELLPEIFTFREILWQPNVYPEPKLCVPQLNILKLFCEEYTTRENIKNTGAHRLYFELLSGLATYCGEAIEKIASSKEVQVSSILGELRKKAFPIVKFFIFHPMNRSDYQTDALNRLNYAVKIMLTQYHSKYYDLQDPYWNITLTQPNTASEVRVVNTIKETGEKTFEKVLKSKESN